jgi:outer membrane usher protein FimD/PapC
VRHRTTLIFLPVCAAFLVLVMSACSFSASSANISSAKMSTDEDGKNQTETFSPNEPFYCIVELSNAPNDTKVRAVWTAVKAEGAKPNTKIDEAKTTSGSGQLQFNLSNQGPWPTGDYKVDLYLNDAKEPTKTLTFKVK